MKLLLRTLVLAVFGALASGGYAQTPPPVPPVPAATPAPAAAAVKEVAVLKTSAGEMVIEFWTDAAPKTIENFKKLAKKGFYDGTAFHRIMKGFMIQGGDPNTKDPAKESQYGGGGPGYTINAEFNDHLHVKGVISMARTPDPNSAGSQFFICLGTASGLDHDYTTFGKVIKGMDVLEKLGDSPVKPNPYDPRHEVSRPIQRVALESVKIVPADSVK
jgi:peptidyl-prolyl cis-trans isomerase B (cyclophilin B)